MIKNKYANLIYYEENRQEYQILFFMLSVYLINTGITKVLKYLIKDSNRNITRKIIIKTKLIVVSAVLYKGHFFYFQINEYVFI